MNKNDKRKASKKITIIKFIAESCVKRTSLINWWEVMHHDLQVHSKLRQLSQINYKVFGLRGRVDKRRFKRYTDKGCKIIL